MISCTRLSDGIGLTDKYSGEFEQCSNSLKSNGNNVSTSV